MARWFQLIFAVALFAYAPATGAWAALAGPECDQTCREVIGRLVFEHQKTLFPVLAAPVERFNPGSDSKCQARAEGKPAVHAVILAPFYDNFIQMPGTQNDATLWQSVFEQRGGLTTVLRGNEVTRDRMIAGLSDVVGCVRERDLVVVTFSGGAASFGRWGGMDPDNFVAKACTGNELSAGDSEAICQASRTAGVVKEIVAQTDDLILFSSDSNIELASADSMTPASRITGLRSVELSNFASQIRNRGGDVVVVLDTNYAEASALLARQDDARLSRVWRWSRDTVNAAADENVDLFGSGDVAALYAASGDELAYEKPQGTGGVNLGDLTYALTEALRNLANPTIEQLAREADRIMKEGGSRQTPVFEATNPGLRLLSTRETPQSNPDAIEVINPKMRSALAMAAPELEVVARYVGDDRPAFASIDGLNVEIDSAGQFRRTVKLELRLELPIRIYGKQAALLAERRLQFDVDAAKASLAPGGRRFALIIANQNYETFDSLANPIADAEAIRAALVNDFGFATTIETGPGKTRDLFLKDATATDIKRALFDLRKALIAEDQLIVYYAGHGEQDSESTSYWVPVDATKEDFTWIAASEISEDLRKLAAGSVLLISDSCYAGGLSRSIEGDPPPIDDARGRYLAKAAQYKARQLIASGGDEPVQDGGGGAHSLFARALLEGLKEMPETVFSASELFNSKVKPKAVEFAFSSPVQGQTPAHLRLARAGDQPESEFIFVRK